MKKINVKINQLKNFMKFLCHYSQMQTRVSVTHGPFWCSIFSLLFVHDHRNVLFKELSFLNYQTSCNQHVILILNQNENNS